MKISSTIGGLLPVFLGLAGAQVTWPSSIDELEDVMFLGTGYKNRGFPAHITPCSYSEFGPGRQTAAEWLRIGFHDMSTANVFLAPHGGIDASIAFELYDGENIGAGFNTSLTTYAGLYNSELPVSDLIALGVYASVRGCGGPAIPMRGGRIDATKAGPPGVPQPQNAIGLFETQFYRMGFSTTDMIQMTACGHTLGGVHAGDFPNIVAPGTVPNDFQLFDNTYAFDNQIAVRYINGPDTDPLAVGISVASGRDSDFTVFTADNNVTVQAMTNAATFNSVCSSILQRMIETVDPTIVTLSPIIQPYEVKPSGLQLTLLAGGAQLTFSGDIRVRTTVRTAAQISSVQILYTDRNGATGGTISTTVSGTANGFDDTFTFYGFSATIPALTSISSFTVVIVSSGGLTQTYNNNGTGFPVQDSVIVQTPQSCFNNGILTVVAAIRSTVASPPSLTITQKVPRGSTNPVPALSNTNATMTAGTTLGPYTVYTGSIDVSYATGAKYGVTSGSLADTFKDLSALGTSCSSTPPSASAAASSSPVSSSQPPSTSMLSSVTSTSATPTPTLSHKQTVGPYTFQGCYTEATNMRALSAQSFYSYGAMTIEMCEVDCAGYAYFGVEYGGECYCGNTINSGSVLAALTDCSFICPGNEYEYCGAGNRLEMYMLSPPASGSSSSLTVVSSTTTLPTLLSSSSLSISTSIITPILSHLSSSSIVITSTQPSSSSLTSALSSSGFSTSTKFITSSSSLLSSSSYSSKASSSFQTSSLSSFILSSTKSSSSPPTVTASSLVTTTSLAVSSSSLTRVASSSSVLFSSSSILSSVLGTSIAVTSSSTSSSATPSPTLGIKPWVGPYAFQGCYTEATNQRALSSKSSYDYPAMTLEECYADCVGYTYFGVEYGGECYCGNTLNAGSVLATLTDCSFTCPGNQYEYCGAGNRLELYMLSSTTSQSTGLSSSSTLIGSSSTSSSASSTLKTSTIFALQSSSTSSSVVTSSSTSSSLSSSTLSSSTLSSSTLSSSTLSSSTLSSSTLSSSTIKSTSTSTIIAIQTAPAIKSQIGNYTYSGCWTEATNTRALNAAETVNYQTMTLEMCSVFCDGYTYWGVEYGGECYCGNIFNAGSVPAPGGDSDCSFTCPGNDLEYCGAGVRLSTYTLN